VHTSPELNDTELDIYHQYLQSDHDFLVWCEVLTLSETQVGVAELLDGQVNFARGDDGPNRTCSLTLSDPEGALNYGVAYTEDDKGVLWVNRLMRIKHAVTVPGLNYRTITATVFIGVPTSVAQKGAELSFELGDKSLLADHGVRARTYKKGANVSKTLVSLLSDLTGERKFRVPPTKKKLSRSYAVGMGEDATTPWDMFKRIAGVEMGWRAYYSCDGFATCEPTSKAKPAVVVKSFLALPDSSTSFTDFSNYAKTTSTRKPKNTQKDKNDNKKKKKPEVDITVIYESVATLSPKHRLSEQSLARNGVPRTLPIVLVDNDLKTMKEVTARSKQQLKAQANLDAENAYEIIPFFHMDAGDYFSLPLGVGKVTFDRASIPLGVNGNMTLGQTKWVSAPVTSIRTRNKTTVHRKRKKGGKKHGH